MKTMHKIMYVYLLDKTLTCLHNMLQQMYTVLFYFNTNIQHAYICQYNKLNIIMYIFLDKSHTEQGCFGLKAALFEVNKEN